MLWNKTENFLPISKARTNKVYIFWQCTNIVCISVVNIVLKLVLSFSGIIQRVDAENLLIGESTGSFLVRVSGRVWGYTISYRAVDRCKHFLVDTSDDGYQFFGTNQIKHATLADLVLFHVVRIIFNRGICCRDLIIVWFHLSMQSLPISIKVLELEVYFISIDWSYGSWIYNYLCNQCLSPLKLWVRYNIMW